MTNGEASLAVKEAAGRTLTSLVGLNFVYNNVDDKKNPTSGWIAELKPEVAGLGGDSRFVRVTGEVRYYYPIWDDVVGMLKAQGGHIQTFGGDKLRLTDHFNPGPSLVRGFAPGGIGPRDIAYDARTGSLGGTTYFGGTAEVQFPIWACPRRSACAARSSPTPARSSTTRATRRSTSSAAGPSAPSASRSAAARSRTPLRRSARATA